MLESAIKFKRAFDCLLMKDFTWYKELRKIGGGLTKDDWKRVGSLLPFLNIFYDATLRLSGSRYVTCNSYVHEICGTSYMIKSKLEGEDEGVKNMATNKKAKYEKYYGDVKKYQCISVVMILDPRHKMTYVEWIVKDNYEETKANLLITKIKLVLDALFHSYASSMSQPKKNQRKIRHPPPPLLLLPLTPKMVEALVGSNDWLRTSLMSLVIEGSLKIIDEMKEGLKDLTLEQPKIIVDETIDQWSDGPRLIGYKLVIWL